MTEQRNALARVEERSVPVRGGGGYAVDLVAVARQAEAAKELGATLIRSGLLPQAIKRPEEAMAVMLTGQELDLSPMFALKNVTVIQGTPALSEQAIGLLIRRAGHKIRIIESTNESCTVEGVRADDPDHPQQVTFSVEDARRAGLLNKNSWKNYTRAMLRARAKTELGRAMFEDALAGLVFTAEELGAEVDEEGQIVEHAPVRELARTPSRPNGDELGRTPARDEVDEAEVVEEATTESAEPEERGDVLRSQIARIENLSEWIWGEKRAVEGKVLDGRRVEALNQEPAKKLIARLQEARERVQAGEQEDPRADGGEEPAPHPDEIEGVERGGASEATDKESAEAPQKPASAEQIELVRSTAAELIENGVAKLEEMLGKPVDELTYDEAHEWLNRLAGRQP